MHVVKACNTRHANFHVLTSARSGYWLFRDTTSYTTIAYKALKTNLKVSEPMLPLIFFLSMHVVKVCNPRNANFHVRTSFRSGHWLFRVTTSYTTMAYKAQKINLKVSEPMLPLIFFLFYACSKGL